MVHPAQRFRAPSTIQAGQPLKALMDRRLVILIAESITAIQPAFAEKSFISAACRGLDALELMPRAAHIGDAIAAHVPTAFDPKLQHLIAAFGPPLSKTSDNGLAVFFYLPHSACIARHGVADFATGMQANYHLTKRFSAEFSIRPFLERYQVPALAQLMEWTTDADPHVRRLVSEGTRPRLPWASRLPAFQADPTLALPLLEKLKDDDSEYVRRSVANHLGDIAKDHPTVAFATCRRWLDEVLADHAPRSPGARRRALIRHAVRLPARQGVAAAEQLRGDAK